MARTPVTPEEITRMQELRSEGLGYREIGRQLGITATTVIRKLDPDYKARQRKANQECQARRWKENPEFRAKQREHERAYRSRHIDRCREQDRIAAEKKRRAQGMKKTERKVFATEEERLQHVKDRTNASRRRQRENDPHFRVACRMRARMNNALARAKAGKDYTTHELLGCSIGEWIATQPAEIVEAMMNGEAVHVDEIRPCSSFDLTDPEQQACCFGWRNRQLLPAFDNLSKSDKWDRPEWEAMMTAKGWTGKLF